MSLAERVWGAAAAAARPLLPLLGRGSSKLARGAAARHRAVPRLERWGRERREADRPALWLHAASAGELIGAVPMVEELRSVADLQLLVTYFSPSARSALELVEPEGAEVLPVDGPGQVRRALRAVRPAALVFAKLDVWPILTREARRAGVPLGLVNGTVRPDSSRLSRPARWLLGPGYGRLDEVGASSREDAGRLVRLGVREEAVSVTGDASFDWALRRARRAREDSASPAARLRELAPAGDPVLVAGSTWRADEEVLLEAVSELERRGGRRPALVLVPHEPDTEALASLAEAARRHLGAAPVLWSEVTEGAAWEGEGGSPGPPPLVVDEVGVLAGLYGGGDLAYVGGGFGEDGLHSLVEPAAAGLPVLFGPRGSRREAGDLVEHGGGTRVTRASAARVLGELVADRERRTEMGRAARAYVEAESGAAGRNAALVLRLLERGAVGRA